MMSSSKSRRGRRAVRRGPRRGLLAALLVAAACVAVSAARASAAVLHEPGVKFLATGTGTPTGPGYLLAVGVESSAAEGKGYIYAGTLSGTYQSAVYKYNSDGTYTGVKLASAESLYGSFGLIQIVEPHKYYLSGIAVDGSESTNKGDIYVADIQHGVVDRFGPEGKFLCQISGKVPSGEPAEKDECNLKEGSETPNAGFTPTGIAIDSSGDVYVADIAHKAIDEFGPKGEYIGQTVNPVGEEPISNPTGVAVGTGGELYIVNGGNFLASGTNVVKESGGTFTTIDTAKPQGIAVDPTTGHLYTQNNEGGNTVEEHDGAGLLWSDFNLGKPFRHVLAVNGASGEIYAGALSTTGVVEAYGPDKVVPKAATAAPTEVQETTAVLHGEAGPDVPHGGSQVESCQFAYVTQSQFEAKGFEGAATAPCEPALPYTAETAVTAEATGLLPATKYHVRLTAANKAYPETNAYSEGEQTLVTSGKPVVVSESASGLTREKATLNAKITPDGYETTYFFEYGEAEGSYGHVLPASPEAIGAGDTPVPVEQTIAEALKVGGVYHYRVVAENSKGTVYGQDETFTTIPPAGIEFQSAIAGPHAATIKASVNPTMGLAPLGDDTTCVLQYATVAEYEASGYANAKQQGHELPCESAETIANETPGVLGAASGAQNVIVRLAGLATNTVYDYRFVVTNESGEGFLERTFATFGVEAFETGLQNAEGGEYSQAGGHPYAFTVGLTFRANPNAGEVYATPGGRLKDAHVELPPGLIGNPGAVPRCEREEVEHDLCSPAGQVGVMELTLVQEEGTISHQIVPVFNVAPPKGVAAEFGGEVKGAVAAFIQASVRTGSDYGVDADSVNIATLGDVKALKVTMWGVPAEASHDPQRACVSTRDTKYSLGCSTNDAPKPFLTAPTACTGTLTMHAEVDSYDAAGDYVPVEETLVPGGMTGCERVRFTPTLEVVPHSTRADSPTGLVARLHVPQEEGAHVLAQSDLRDATVTMPAGVTINPAAAAGLAGCTEEQVGYQPAQSSAGKLRFTAAPAQCPDASKVGEVEVSTPLLDHTLKGGIYVAQQYANPLGSLMAAYLTVDDQQSGVVLKLAGELSLNKSSGQITATFSENPQLPFEDLTLRFFGGQEAPLATPRSCGTYETTSVLEPWSHQTTTGPNGTPNAEPFSTFQITSGPGGGACGASAFAPALAAGTESNHAGSFSPFVMTLSRKDGEQRLGTVSMTMPEGVAGMLSKVPLCSEAQAKSDACPSASQVGHVVAEVGVGGSPDTLPEPGRREDPVYLLGKTEGAPFGLAIVVHPEAGPFNLEEGGLPVIVLAKIEVDPHTAQVSVVSNPMPTMLHGIPVDLKAVHVVIDKSGFMFNPTSCEPMSVTGTIGSAEGASAAVSSRFQAAGCRGMAFKPGFKVLIHAHHSRKDGVYAHFVVTSGPGQANIKSVLVKLPGRLPARLDTLKRSCTEEQFAKDPAGCPSGSKVGHATAYTPVLPVPLKGTAIFVSHGGAAYPDLDVVLKGDGVSVILTGSTHIDNKTGVTTSHFKSVPDVPITRFDLVLPAKRYSALGANGNLCYRTVVKKKRVRVRRHGKWVHVVKKTHRQVKRTITMPTTITGQNGAVVKKNAKVAVTGCGKAKAKGSSRKGSGHKGRGPARHHKHAG